MLLHLHPVDSGVLLHLQAEIDHLITEMARLKEQKEIYKKRAEALRGHEELMRRQKMNQALREVLHTQRLAWYRRLWYVDIHLVP